MARATRVLTVPPCRRQSAGLSAVSDVQGLCWPRGATTPATSPLPCMWGVGQSRAPSAPTSTHWNVQTHHKLPRLRL